MSHRPAGPGGSSARYTANIGKTSMPGKSWRTIFDQRAARKIDLDHRHRHVPPAEPFPQEGVLGAKIG